MGMIKVYRPLSSEINFPKLTSTTFGFPGRMPLSAAPGLGAMRAVQSESFDGCGEGLSSGGGTDHLRLRATVALRGPGLISQAMGRARWTTGAGLGSQGPTS